MKRTIPLLLFTLAGCNAQRPPAPASGAVALGAHVSCIDLTQVTARRVLPPSSVLFDVNGGISYRADFVGSCPSAARATGSDIVQTETQTTHLCRDDRIRIYDPVEAKATGAGAFPFCRIAGFTAVPSR